ncbi:MAG: hypothetical protein WBH49_03110 [Flavobacteriaceae bacterium]|nr:hypothetical protein [Flavobacteriaceae bacterium]
MKKAILLSAFIVLACSSGEGSDDTPNMCVDETLIDLELVCVEIFEPVCGCDGVTYNNSCEAFNWNGVLAYQQGACD